MRYNIGLLLLMGCYSVFGQVPVDLSNTFQTIIQNALVDPGVKGISACVIMPDGSSWMGQAGDNGSGIPIDENTVFYAGSTTKNFIATRVLQLWENDAIELDAPYTTYINPIENIQTETTIRQLLNHTSGVYDYIGNPIFFNDVFSDFSYSYEPLELLSSYLNQPHNFSPGTNHEYSNTNYIVLGLIIESITGNALATELRNHIFEPLSLNKTYLGGYETFQDQHCGLHWLDDGTFTLIDYTPNFPHQSLLTCAYASGGIVSHPADEATYIRQLMNGEFIGEEALNEMLTLNTFSSNYGLGTIAIPAGGDTVLYGHTGGIGNITEMFHCPLLNVTIVVMQNSMNASIDTFFQLYLSIVDHLDNTIKVKEQSFSSLSIFPNPADETLHITNAKNKIRHIHIYSITGNLVLRVSPSSFSQEIAIGQLASGNYKVSIELETGEIFHHSIYKK